MESRIHEKHPLWLIRAVVNDCLADLPPEFERLLSKETFPVDGTLIDARAPMKSFRRHEASCDQLKDGGDDDAGPGRHTKPQLCGAKRCSETRASTTGPEARSG